MLIYQPGQKIEFRLIDYGIKTGARIPTKCYFEGIIQRKAPKGRAWEVRPKGKPEGYHVYVEERDIVKIIGD